MGVLKEHKMVDTVIKFCVQILCTKVLILIFFFVSTASSMYSFESIVKILGLYLRFGKGLHQECYFL